MKIWLGNLKSCQILTLFDMIPILTLYLFHTQFRAEESSVTLLSHSLFRILFPLESIQNFNHNTTQSLKRQISSF